MKKLFPADFPKVSCTIFCCIAAILGTIAGCKTSTQQVTYQSLATIETTADVGFSNYVALVISGQVSTNSLWDVCKAYNDLHAAIATGAVIDQSGSNVLVSTNVTAELSSFLNLISTVTKK